MIGVVVPAHDEAAHIGSCLAAIGHAAAMLGKQRGAEAREEAVAPGRRDERHARRQAVRAEAAGHGEGREHLTGVGRRGPSHEDALPRLRVDGLHDRPPPQPRLAQRHHVVHQVVLRGGLVEHRGDVLGVLLQGGAAHVLILAPAAVG